MVSSLVEGMSIALTVEMTGVSKNTIVKLLVDLGVACSQYLDRSLRDLPCRVVECDEIWSFGSPRTKHVPINHEGEFGFGDVWTWTALDADTKLVPSWLVGRRDNRDCFAFLFDLRSRIAPGPAQLTTNARSSYLSAMEPLFNADRSHYAMLIEMFGGDVHDLRRSPPAHTGITREILTGVPDSERISTSDLERTGLTTRIGVRPPTSVTEAFRRKVENHTAAISLHFIAHNFAQPLATLSEIPGSGKSDHPSHGHRGRGSCLVRQRSRRTARLMGDRAVS